MRFIVENLGPVRHADMDVRPLMVIIGKNNVGKTWLAYTMAMAWKLGQVAVGVIGPRSQASTVPMRSRATAISSYLNASLSSKNFSLGQRLFQDGYGNFDDARIKVLLRTSDITEAMGRMEADPLELEGTVPSERSGRSRGDRLSMQVEFVKRLSTCLFPPALVFPAERNSFILTYRLLVSRRFALLRDRLRYGIDDRNEPIQQQGSRDFSEARFPQPIEDFLDFLSEVEGLAISGSRSTQETRLKPTLQYADLIEDAIHGGQRLRWVPTPLGGGGELSIAFGNGRQMDLHNAASSIKQLAPLVLYLRYMAPRRSFLIIDEPEMNLHPEAQARFVEIMALLVQAGHQVLLTTHSPYILAHLNNIIAGSSNPETRAKQAGELYLQNPGAFLRPDQVGAWELDDEGLKPLYEEGWGIRYTTLSDPADEISRRYYAIRAMDDDGDPA